MAAALSNAYFTLSCIIAARSACPLTSPPAVIFEKRAGLFAQRRDKPPVRVQIESSVFSFSGAKARLSEIFSIFKLYMKRRKTIKRIFLKPTGEDNNVYQ
jgi:hypothetical protein